MEDRQVDDYLAEARKRFEARAEVERQAEFGKALERLEMLFKSTLSDKDYKTALQVQKELSVLLGLNAPKTVHVTDWRTDAINAIKAGDITRADLERELGGSLADELFRQAGVTVMVTAGED